MKIQELKEELRLLGEKTGGSKAELVARLEAANKRARDESEKLERGEISGALVLYDGEFAGQQQGDESEEPEEWQQDQYTPFRKRFKQGCDCYRCTGETFSVEGPRGSSIHAEATSICATMRLGCSITRRDLQDFTNDVPLGGCTNGAVYNPRRCPAVQLATSHPETNVNLYSCEQGPAKLVCLGARTKNQARKALRRVARLVQKSLEVPAQFLEFRVANYIMSGDIGFHVDLDRLLISLNSEENNQDDRNSASYEPELSPKLSYTMESPADIRLDMFHTGKINILRCLRRQDLEEAFTFLYPILLNHKVEEAPPPQALAQPTPTPLANVNATSAPAESAGPALVSAAVEDAFFDMLQDL